VAEVQPATAHHFQDLAQQRDANRLGMWTFLASEVLFFGVLFLVYLVYRAAYPAVFLEAGRHLNVWLGTLNTAVLLCSSLTVVLAVHAAEARQQRRVRLFLLVTAGLGLIFLGIKAVEYYVDYQEGLIPALNFHWEGADALHAELFFTLYFIVTGLHALHLLIGIVIALVMSGLARRGWYDQEPQPVELFGLYWHFVDVVWIYLFPLLYLIGRP
jgi:cytochrome c oxidase subunit 3